MNLQSAYQKAIHFAAQKHAGQMITGTRVPYLVHVCNVAMEILIAGQHTPGFNTIEAVQVALPHDTIEDTDTSYEELSDAFTENIAAGVLALSKNEELPQQSRYGQPEEDQTAFQRNMGSETGRPDRQPAKAPELWSTLQKSSYLDEAVLIATHLEGGNAYLENRIRELIHSYKAYTL
ncbi:HD domain-containing protein [Niabella sp. W65]|nr:HD domain-containing protein [Niabella sp. W65]MCH7361841.1 HD domain-containing protein [Niabella sp. W65]